MSHEKNANIPVTWQTRQRYKQHYSAAQENKPSSPIPGFATFDPENHQQKIMSYDNIHILISVTVLPRECFSALTDYNTLVIC